MNRPVRVAVDYTAGIDPREQLRLGIHQIPIRITGLPEEIESRLTQGDVQAFYTFLAAQESGGIRLGTQAGSVLEIRQVFEEMIQRVDCDIVGFVVSGRLSAVYDNALRAAQQLAGEYPNRIAIFGEQAFLTLSLLARLTAEYALSGRGIEEVLDFVEDKLGRGFVCGSLLDVSRLRRSGRVAIPRILTALARPVLSGFRLLPVFILEGDTPRVMRVIRKSRFHQFVCDAVEKRVGFLEPIVVQVSWTGDEVYEEAKRLKEFFEGSDRFVLARPVILERASPVVGVHAGSALVGFGVLGLGYSGLATPVFLRFLECAAEELATFHRVVNAINVFPVRDGDTGNNLLSPLAGAGEGVSPALPFKEMLKRVVVRIARRGGGYSGGAIAAYFLGFNEYVEKRLTDEGLTLEVMVGALRAGTDRCYEYFGSEAKEGTILSVMRACAQAARRAFERHPSWRNVLTSAYLAATEELLSPRVQEVEVLRREGMVDAGGFGFTLILWALLRTLGLARQPVLQERYRQVLKEVRRHAELGQRLIYRREPEAVRGFCVEGCVRGEVAEELEREFRQLDNRLPNPKMTFNVVEGTTHFHIHVSEGLEQAVQHIAARFGYCVPPPPPTPLAKRRREIYRFRFVNIFRGVRRLPGYIAGFFANWVAYALFFPVMWYRARRRMRSLEEERDRLRLVQRAFEVFSDSGPDGSTLLVFDATGRLLFGSGPAVQRKPANFDSFELTLPPGVIQVLQTKLTEFRSQRLPVFKFTARGFAFDVRILKERAQEGFLVFCRPDREK